MLRTPEEMKGLTHELMLSAWTAGAIGALYECGLATELTEPRTVDELAKKSALGPSRIASLLELVATTGIVLAEEGRWRLADGAKPFAAPPMRAVLEGDLRTSL